MSLNWKDVNGDGKLWIAEYDGYDTPAGPAKCRAKVSFRWGLWDYETFIEDPYIASVSTKYYLKISYGSESTVEEAKEICEKAGYRHVMDCLGDFDIRMLYNENFKRLAIEYAYQNHEVIEEFIRVDDFTAQMRVLDGGYEPARIEVWMNEDLSFGEGYK